MEKTQTMVVYDLACAREHRFEGWFESASSFEKQRDGGGVSCPMCNSREITRLPSAPYVNTPAAPVAQNGPQPQQGLSVSGAIVAAIREQVVKYVMANTEDVGDAFSEIALQMHYEELPERNIRGIASEDELMQLHEEGVDVMMLDLPEPVGPKH